MPRRLLVPQDDLSLPGLSKLGNVIVIIQSYQLYAVERWIVDRHALLRLLVVYTGDPAHSVHLHVYQSDDDDDPNLWFAALDLLAAQSGAKPKHTSEGVLMLTSLAHFRSDYTIVLIPHGLFSLPIKNQLYTNINLLRLGSSGRTALTLSDPSESTKERFLSTYHTKPDLVLPLVALIQSALSIFGSPLHTDGLLCDSTVHAIKHWIDIFASPSDRTVDPSFISLLLSLILSTRNKLAHLGYSHLLPPDPFSHPLSSFTPALASYSQSQSQSAFIPLTKDLINSISASFDSKRLSRVIRTKLNSDTPPTTSTTDSLLAPVPVLSTFISIVSSSPGIAPDSLSTIWSLFTSVDLPLSPKHRKRHKQKHLSRGGVASDGDNARTKRYDSRSTEEESEPLHRIGGSLGHGFHWPHRRVKLRSWAGLAKRKHQSVDLTPALPLKQRSPQRERDRDRPLPALPQDHPSKTEIPTGPASGSNSALSLSTSVARKRPSRRSTVGPAGPTGSGSMASTSASIFLCDAGRAQSPTLPPLHTFFGEGDDEDLLSSGQISPLSDSQTRPNPFFFSLGGSQAHLHTTSAPQSTPYLHPYPNIYAGSIFPNTSDQIVGSKPTNSLSAHTATSDNPVLNIDEKMLARLLLDKGKGKRTRRDSNDTSGSGGGSGSFGGRIASWAGPVTVSARGWADSDEESDEEEEGSAASAVGKVGLSSKSMGIVKSISAGAVPPKDWGKKDEKDKGGARFNNLVRVVDGDGRLAEEEITSEEEDNSGEESGDDYAIRSGRVSRRTEEERTHEAESGEDGEIDEEEEERREAVRRRAARGVAKGELKRRRSFHDLDTFRALEVLSPERMKIDVELCGQCLIMWRREKHLRNVVDCVRVLTSILSKSNTLLRTHYQSHVPTLTTLTTLPTPNYASANFAVASSNPSSSNSRSSSPKPSTPPPPFSHSPSPPLLSESPIPIEAFPTLLLQSVDEASHQTERFSQATNTLLYESEQFDVGGLWSWVGRERRKVWALRGDVFGEGNGGGGAGRRNGNDDGNNGETGQGTGGASVGRKLPEGIHGAHGSFNRLQWRLDGRGVLVDELGRTESEAEEEERVERRGAEVDGGVGTVHAMAAAGEAPGSESSRKGDEGQEAIKRPAAEGEEETSHVRREDEELELEFLDRHLGIKPMWLLKFFTSWGARWGAVAANATTGGTTNGVGSVDAMMVDTNETNGMAGIATNGVHVAVEGQEDDQAAIMIVGEDGGELKNSNDQNGSGNEVKVDSDAEEKVDEGSRLLIGTVGGDA